MGEWERVNGCMGVLEGWIGHAGIQACSCLLVPVCKYVYGGEKSRCRHYFAAAHLHHTSIHSIHSPTRAMREPTNAATRPNETQEINCHSWQFPASSNLCRGSIPTVDLRFNALLNSLDHRCRLCMAGVRITTTDYEHVKKMLKPHTHAHTHRHMHTYVE